MNRIDLTQLNGFRFGQRAARFMQDAAIDMFASVANMVGDKRIISGVEVVNGNVTDGYISYQGEILKFVGAAAGPDVIILETTEDSQFADDVLRPVYKTRVATIGAPGDFPFSDLQPANIGVPVGTVLMWSGNVVNMPAGFALCDGTNGTPDLRGKFIVGYDPTDADYNAEGKTGGAKSVILTEGQMPKHGHSLSTTSTGPTNNDGADPMRGSITGTVNTRGQKGTVNKSIGAAGNNEAHENRPPYYTLAYIIKL